MSRFSVFDTDRLAVVLRHANTCRHDTARFYAAKKQILLDHGKHVGFDLQHIDYECWGCYGKGCNRCVNGCYRSVTNVLERWRIGRNIFHVPRREDGILDQRAIFPTQIIRGKIRHNKSKIGPACQRLIVAIYTGSVFDYFSIFDLPDSELKRVRRVYSYLTTKKAITKYEEMLITF